MTELEKLYSRLQRLDDAIRWLERYRATERRRSAAISAILPAQRRRTAHSRGQRRGVPAGATERRAHKSAAAGP